MSNLGSGSDNVNIDGATSSFIDFGGVDTYTLLNSLSGDVTITDNQVSTINLPTGLTIGDALFLSDGVQFGVNGHTVTLLGNPSLFSFIFGGTPLDPTAGTPQTFAETATAFGTTIPAAGAAPNSGTNTGTVNADGTIGSGTVNPPGDNKEDPSNGTTDDANEDDKVNLVSFFEEKPVGDISISLNESDDVINLSGFRADPRFSGIDGSGYTVVVLDTGIDPNHPAFGPDRDGNGVADRIIYALDFTREGDGTPEDFQGHGTHVAATIGASDPSFTGVAPNVNIVALQVLDNSGSGSLQGIEESLQWVIANAEALNVVAVNMSLGGLSNDNFVATNPALGDEFRVLSDNLGISVVVAAGNAYEQFQQEGASSISQDPNTLAVGAVGGTASTGLQATSFSQRSDDIPTIFAPGGGITAAAVGGGNVSLSGTSMAAPHIAGMVALAQQIAEQNLGRRLSPDEITTLLTQSAVSFIDSERPDDRVINTGSQYERVDMLSFAEAILGLGGGNPPPTQADTIPGDPSSSEQIAVGASRTGTIDFSGDQDFYAVTLAPGSYTFELRGAASNSGTLADPLLALHSATGSFLTANDDTAPGNLESTLEFTTSQGGTFFLNAAAYESNTGSYTLSVTSTGTGGGDIADNINTTASVPIGGSVTSSVDFGSDVDFFRVSLQQGQSYQFDLSRTNLPDPFLGLLDAQGSILAFDDDSGGNGNAQINFEAVRTGDYFLAALDFTTTGTGGYIISANTSTAAADDFTGNTSTTGSLAASGGSASGQLEVEGDVDWFRIDLQANTTYTFRVSGDQTGSELRDPLMRLHDQNGIEIASNDDSNGGLDSELVFTATTSQTIYVAAEAYNGAGAGGYLVTSMASASSGDVASDTSTSATISPGQIISGIIDQPGDTDWYAVNVVAGGTYQFDMAAGIGANPIDDAYLTLFDSGGQRIGFDDDGGNGRDASLVYQPMSSGRVYISAEVFDFSSDQGSYVLGLVASGAGTGGDIPGDITSQAVLPTSGAVIGVLEQPGDRDWFRIEVTAGQTIQLDLFGTGSDPLPDPFLGLRDAQGNVITFNDDGGAGFNSQLIYTPDFSGTAFVTANAFNDQFDGLYALTYTTGIDNPSSFDVSTIGVDSGKEALDMFL